MTKHRPLGRWTAVAVVISCATAAWAQEPLDPALAKAEQERIEAIAKASRTAVSVFARGGRGGGSGVVITPDGYALTNFHVSKPAGNHMKCSMADGRLYDAVIVGIDPTGDVALIKLLGRDDFPHAELADSDEVKVGDFCFAVGNPFLLATDFQPTVTWGIVSGVHRYQYPAGTLLEYADCIQTDASINPGNSGGPLFNAKGQLIGINGRGSFEKRGRVNVGVGYAISINQIKHFMGYLRSGRIVDHATLGVRASSGDEGRVVVTEILDTSDAYRRGMRYGDVITAFGGRPINTVNAFKNVLGIFPKGWRAPITFLHDGKEISTFVRLQGVHSKEELIKKISGRPQMPQPKPGDKKPGDKQPGEGKPGDKQPGDGDKPQPIPNPLEKLIQRKQPMPPHVAKLFEARRGYANYYFNRLNRDRIWKAFTKHGDFTGLSEAWRIEGELGDGKVVELLLDSQGVLAQIDGQEASVVTGQALDKQLMPKGSGGLLVALHVWRRLLTTGPEKFGETYYSGSVPLVKLGGPPNQPWRENLADALVATYNVIESRLLFDPESGQLLAMSMFPETHVDPCELYFADYREVDGRKLPHRIEIRHGDNLYGVLTVKAYRLPEAAADPPEQPATAKKET